ncbi:Fur family transcriptional regulator, ferric uptake regulator [Micromonospora sediminicola]|uniref:Fur family transcriptional regulator, ferric uptake regulator n=1 Tax=Micromonospora sediminicola TaxID=946078 RepID=A0A1A9BA20_9ACTN|nr:transcriptional repressor [Micromonospora sediminicola]SBT65747.1 Fur family transcriptional regulator, ferric uptake regulator [Micromonospora sediminicola]
MITSQTDRVSAVLDRLRRAGHRTTLARRGVVHALGEAAEERQHLSASEVHLRLTGRGRPVELSTVHRVLTHLVDLGVAHVAPVGGAATFGMAGRPHHQAVCQGCGGMRQLPTSAVAGTVTAARAVGVEVDPDGGNGGVVVYGWCASCRTRIT